MTILRKADRPDRLVSYTEVGEEEEVDVTCGVARIDLATLAALAERHRALVPEGEDASTLHLCISGMGDDGGLFQLVFQFCTSRVETDAEYEARLQFEHDREAWAKADAEKKERQLYARLKKKFEGNKP